MSKKGKPGKAGAKSMSIVKNLPSTTGYPSGKGRGNNPPKSEHAK
jgi:hypothetical protein